MPRSLILRVQSKNGRLTVNSLTPDSTLRELQQILEEKTKLLPNVQKILLGYPPRELVSYSPDSSLHSLRIQTGETLFLEELPSDKARRNSERKVDLSATGDVLQRNHTPTPPLPSGSDNMGEVLSCLEDSPHAQHGRLVRRVVPADNSCLFKSISILLCNNRETGGELRELAAGIILSDPAKYSSAFLGKGNQEYVSWLQRKESWGGAIELTVFSEHYKVELDVVDIQTQRIDRFGEDKGYATRAFLLYDGIHYDPIVMDFGSTTSQQCVFPVKDAVLLVEAQQIARDAYKARKYTDLSRCSLRCLVCQKGLTGQTDALTHAQETGHSNFGEVTLL